MTHPPRRSRMRRTPRVPVGTSKTLPICEKMKTSPWIFLIDRLPARSPVSLALATLCACQY